MEKSEKVKIEPKKITVIGSGFVGKATGKGFMAHGHDVTFVDINEIVLENLNQEGMSACDLSGECASDRDVYFVTILTPTINDHLDFRFIDSALSTLGRALKHHTGQPTIVIRSTVLPGTIENRFIPLLEKYSGKRAGKDFGVAMNPEFLREIHAEKDFKNPWIIVIGANDSRTMRAMKQLYKSFPAPIVEMSIKEAEMMKYVHNIYNADKIAFFNEMRMIGKEVGVDSDKIFRTVIKSAEASWNPEYGIRDFGPFSGSCLPKDTRAFLSWADENLKKKMPILQAIIKFNEDLKFRKYLES